MTHEMIERVALAICGDDNSANILTIHRIRARLVIKAMREPTEDMIEEVEFNTPSGEIIGRCEAKNVWQGMIDKALEE